MINKIITEESTSIHGASFDGSVLEVMFKGGTVYHYLNVTQDDWNDFIAAILRDESAGKAFHRIIRSGPFPYRKVA